MNRLLVAMACLGLALASFWQCSEAGDGDSSSDSDVDSDSDSDSDSDTDSDSDADSDSDSDTDSDSDADGDNMCPGEVQSFIWIANTGESTLSKVCTLTGEEVARYKTCPATSCDPSRTSVNLHGDMVVTNRDPASGPSSVTKFASDMDDCVDQNDNSQIETSTGPDQVLPFGEDECMLWNTELGGDFSIGARATAWDGTEDPDSGEGGHVFIGAMMNHVIYKIDGDTGAILDEEPTQLQHYGGAVDGQGNFWTVAMGCTIGLCQVERISLDDLTNHETHNVHCGYGISVDGQGRIWTGGMNIFGGGGCISRLVPETDDMQWVITAMADFNRGIAVGTELSAGSVWAASSNGDLIQVNMETLEITHREAVGIETMVGVAIDFEGYVWTVSQGGNAAHKVHPETWEVIDVPIGSGPYTYSDMTGMQLKNVIPIE